MTVRLGVKLPCCSEKNLEKITRLYNNAITALCNNSSANEKRFVDIDRKTVVGTGKYSTEKHVGKHYKFTENSNNGLTSLELYYSEDGEAWDDPPITTWTPPY